MKLYVIDPYSNNKIYLNLIAKNRISLARKIGSYTFYIHGVNYDVNQVFAEDKQNDIAIGTVLGGVVGLLGGAPGVLIGGALGGLLGGVKDNDEQKKIRIFNNSVA